MSEKNGEVERISEQIHKNYCIAYERKHGKPYWTGGDYSKLDEPTKEFDRIQARYFIQLCDQKDRDHEALIGVLVGTLETLKWLIDMQADLKHRASQQDTNAYDKAVMALSHPLVQEYLKKEKSDHDFKTCLCHPDGGG